MKTRYGIDYIGGVNYRRVIKKHHPTGYAAGFLCYASGWKNGILAARSLAAAGGAARCPVMRISGIWRDDHNFTEKDIPRAVKQAEKVAALAADYPEIKIFFSPWLEHRADKKLWNKCKKACRKVLPRRVKIVNCGPARPKGINEVHHSNPVPGKYIFSFDGKDMFKSSVPYWKSKHKNSLYFYGWFPQLNGKCYLNDSTPRSQRKCWPRGIDIKKAFLELGY